MSDSSDVYLTPNTTLTGPPDVIRQALHSPASAEYSTPDTTLCNEHFAMPSYFDKKKKAAATIISAAVHPLTNFQIFKQKSLNTIPALIERNKRNEELFNNFPFLTPLAHRKSSLISDANRLSGCIEDEFYSITSDPEADPASADHIDIRHRFKSMSNKTLDKELATSTPKEVKVREVLQRCHYASERRRGDAVPLRHSYTGARFVLLCVRFMPCPLPLPPPSPLRAFYRARLVWCRCVCVRVHVYLALRLSICVEVVVIMFVLNLGCNILKL